MKADDKSSKKTKNIQQTPGVLQATALKGMSPLSLMEAQKNMQPGTDPDQDGDGVPLSVKMYPSARRP